MRHRVLKLETRRADPESRTIPATISSEYPVDRGGFDEVLEHSSRAVDLSRAPLPLIESHDSQRLNIGVVENVRLEGKKLKGDVRLGESARAREVFEDIRSNVVRNLSVGYLIQDYRDEGNRVVVTRWQPLEVSAVAIPADPTAGFYRSYSQERKIMPEHYEVEDEFETEDEPKLSRSQRRRLRREAEQRESEDERIHWMGERFKARELADEIIANNGTADDMKRALRERILNAKPKPVPAVRDYVDTRVEGASTYPGLRGFATQQDAYAAGMWARSVLFGDERAKRWVADTMGTRALAGSSNSAGGAMVPEEMSSAIINLVNEYGVARRECDLVPMNSDTMVIPRRSESVNGFFIGENSQFTESEGSFDNVQLSARKLGVLTRMSSELVEDAVIDVAAFLAEEFGRQFAKKEDDCLFNGDGTSTYGGIQGVRSKLLSGTKAGAVTVATATHDTFGEIDETDLATLMAALPQYALRGAKWYCSPQAHALVFQRLAQAAGGASMMEVGGVMLQQYAGFPIVVTDQMPTSTGSLDGQVMLLFGNMRMASTFGDRRAYRTRVDESRYLEYDQIAVMGTERFDINVHDVGDDSTAGPVVGLVGSAS